MSVVVHPSILPSIKRVFSETIKRINANFYRKVAVHPISRPFSPFFKILEFEFNELFFIFVNMEPYGSENFKMILLLQLQFFYNQAFSTYSLWQSSQNLLIGILKFYFKFEFEKKRLKFSLTWDPMGVKISKRYFSYSLYSFSTKLFLNVPCNNPHKPCFLKFCNFRFKFKKKIEIKHCAQGEIKNCQYLENGQLWSKPEWHLGLWGILGNICTISGTLANGQVWKS